MLKKIFSVLFAVSIILFESAAMATSIDSEFTPVNWREPEFVPMSTGEWRWARVINCNDGVNLREQPSVNSRSLAFIPVETLVKVYRGQLGENSGSPWYGFFYTDYDGKRGWVAKNYLRVGKVHKVIP